MQTNCDWIFDKASLHDFTKDEIHGFLMYLEKNSKFIVQGNKNLPSKFDLMIRRFISEQQAKNPANFTDIANIESFQSLFEQFKPEFK